MALLAQLDALGFHPSFILCLIEALSSVGRTLEADCLFQEMIWFFGFEPRIKLYNAFFRGFLKKGLFRSSG